MQGVGPAELISFRAFGNAGQGREEVVITIGHPLVKNRAKELIDNRAIQGWG
jgi:hypothetical protein